MRDAVRKTGSEETLVGPQVEQSAAFAHPSHDPALVSHVLAYERLLVEAHVKGHQLPRVSLVRLVAGPIPRIAQVLTIPIQVMLFPESYVGQKDSPALARIASVDP